MNERRPALSMIASMLIFGTIGLFRRGIPVPSGFLACVRGLMGGLVLLAFGRLRPRSRREALPRRTFGLLALSGGLIGLNWMLLFEAYGHTTVAVATLCYYMQPTIVLFLSPLIFREALTARKAACGLVALMGMALVSGVFGGAQAGSPRGVLLGLGAAMLYALVVILNKWIRGVDPFQKTTIQLLCAGLIMVPYLLVTRDLPAGPFSGRTVLLLLVVGLIHTGLAYILYFGSMEGLKAQTIALLSYIDPVSALLFSRIFLGERLTAAGILGAVLILGSALVSEGLPEKNRAAA